MSLNTKSNGSYPDDDPGSMLGCWRISGAGDEVERTLVKYLAPSVSRVASLALPVHLTCPLVGLYVATQLKQLQPF